VNEESYNDSGQGQGTSVP